MFFLWVHCFKLWGLSVIFQTVVKTRRCLNLAQKKKCWILGCGDPLSLLQSAGMISNYMRFLLPWASQAGGIQNLNSGCRPRMGCSALWGKVRTCRRTAFLHDFWSFLGQPQTNNESWKCLVSIVSLLTCQMSESNLRVI